ncbi:SusC/RagA family TonB-linked outer membrane protein [Chryseobacterium sp. A321]
MKNILSASLIVLFSSVYGQHTVSGTVIDQTDQKPLTGILITSQHSKTASLTDKKGEFNLKTSESKLTILASGQGYIPQKLEVELPLLKPLKIFLVPKIKAIEEVILSTGYEQISKERATGSYSVVGDKLLRKQVTTGIMERLPAIANGITMNSGLSETHLMVRGLSSINGPKSPLIIVDDFPYEGDMNNISPDMVESITVLKDAAASSIWGARAANGVIVITTKKGKYSQPLTVELTVNTTFSDKPDLTYNRRMTSSEYIDVERELFSRGSYKSRINSSSRPVLSPVVDLLNQAEKGFMTSEEADRQIDALRKIDIRDQYHRYMYTPLHNQQYALNLSGGSSNFNWISSLGYDENFGNLSEEFKRLNFSLQNTWKLSDRIRIQLGALYTHTKNKSGRIGFDNATVDGNLQIPYLQFSEENGKPAVFLSKYNQRVKDMLVGSGLYDWNYYPLTDWEHSRSTQSNAEVTLNTSIQYKIVKGLDLNLKYQYQTTNENSRTLYDEESYYTRDYLNGFAYYNSSNTLNWNVPRGAILDKSVGTIGVNNVRGQLNYNYSSTRHDFTAIAGAEARAWKSTNDQDRLYGYDVNRQTASIIDYLTQYPHFITGSKSYVANRQGIQEFNNRFISMYANAAYVFDKKYILSASARRDASNLFGLKTNDQWNPFWSAGFSWNLSNEKFYSIAWLPSLKFRSSYGFSGNIDPAMVAVTTLIFDQSKSIDTGGVTARISNFSNPSLRWETSKMVNLAIDFASKNNRIAGSIDYFMKNGSNLFGEAPLDATTGIKSMLWNVAGMKSKGFDLELNTRNIVSRSFSWNSILNFSSARDQITEYYLKDVPASYYVNKVGNYSAVSGKVGLPVYSIFAYKWAGLDPVTGDPQGFLDGEISKDYAAITGSDKGIEDLEYFGSAIPTTYGSFINTFSYGQFSLDIAVSYKLGYWFRRSSIDYGRLLSGSIGHGDFSSRWQNPGDEKFTDIPSLLYSTNQARDIFYAGSSALIEKGDHVRLQYLNLGYDFGQIGKSLSFQTLRIYCAINNLGLLWSANKQGIDPDYFLGTNSIKSSASYSLGLHLKF